MTNNLYLPEGSLIHTPENREHVYSIQGLEKAMLSGKILESTAVMCDSASRLHVDLHGTRGYIAREECLLCREGEAIKDIAIITRVGKPVCFKIMKMGYDDAGPFAILSRREAQRECIANYLSKLKPGDIIPSKVTHTENFGAFVDIGCGISSLLSIDCISVSRISRPSDRISVGMDIYTVVKSIDQTTGRIFVSLRELLGTWEENASMLQSGNTVAGIIRSIESYGIFVELSPNLAGLAELRDGVMGISAESMIGRRAAVYIKSIIPERMKIKLVLIDIGDLQKATPPLKYFTDPSQTKHIDRWRYSPSVCGKLVESVFDIT